MISPRNESVPLGQLVSRTDLTEIKAWLADFPEYVVNACHRWFQSDSVGTWIVEPAVELAEFRVQAQICLMRVLDTLSHLCKTLPSPGRIIWCIENWENRGLDDFEAEAVFGAWLDIDLLSQLDAGKAKSRVVISGRLREEYVGLSFLLADVKGVTNFKRLLSLYFLAHTKLPITTIFIGHEQATYLAKRLWHPLAVFLRQVLRKKETSLGLWVPPERTNLALADMKAELTPLMKILAGCDTIITQVRFAESVALNPPYRLAQALKLANLACDSSLIVQKGMPALNGKTKRIGPYFRAGAYQPQPFDIRTPLGAWTSNGWLELVSLHLGELSLSEFWDWRLGYDTERIAQLLDFKRMETYFRDMEKSVELAQRYHEYRIYSWPSPDTSPRSTFVDCGTLDHPYKVLSVLNQSQEMMRKFGFRWCLVGERKFLAVAKTEAEKRLRIEISPILADQIKAHEYLEILPSYNQLREDTIHFITFLPPMLGQTLEMGSGYGQLARVLSPRAKSYICVDLGLKMFKDLKQELGQYGIVADAHYLPFAEETFDTIIADNFLEHLYDPLTCLKEVFRVLRHGGRLYAMIPLDALNAEHSRCAHLWKADEENIHHALEMANLVLVRCEIIDLYEMGVSGAFPACNGLLCKVEAMKSPDGIC